MVKQGSDKLLGTARGSAGRDSGPEVCFSSHSQT